MDGQPGLRRRQRPLRASRTAGRRHPPADATRARASNAAPSGRDQSGTRKLRAVVRTVPLRARHGDRPGVGLRRGRDGVPHVLHLRHRHQPAVRGRLPRRRHRARGRAPVLVRHRRQQRVRVRLDRRGSEHLLDGANDAGDVRRQLHDANVRAAAGRPRDPVAGVPGAQTRHVDRPPRRLPRERHQRRSEHADVPLPPRHRRQPVLQQDRVVVAHAREPSRLGNVPTDHGGVLRALQIQASDAGRFRSSGRRGFRAGPRLVFRSSALRLGGVRLRDRFRE